MAHLSSSAIHAVRDFQPFTITQTFFAIAFLLSVIGVPRDLDASDDRPNVILVMADDMGWAQTGYRNHPVLKTPNLDAMAEGGIRFDRFYAGAPVCSPTRASVLTGRSNDRTAVLSHGYAMDRQEVTLATLMKQAGYVTGHFGKWHLNGLRGPGVPILHTDEHGPGKFGFDQWLSVTNFFDRDPILSRRGKFEAFQGDSSEIIVEEALDFIARQKRQNQPFFAVIWYGSPHDPFRADDLDMEAFADLDAASRNHYGELVAMDRSLGTLRKKLRELDAHQNTLLWFCSDNGGLNKIQPSSVAPLRGHKNTIYEGGLLVPSVLEWPSRIQEAHVVQGRASTMDIFPTVLSAIGQSSLAPEVPRDGQNLMPMIDRLVEGEPWGQRTTPIHFRHEGRLAVIDGDLKLLTTDIRRRVFELYDLKNDLSETTDLFAKRPDDARRLMQLMIQWNESVQQSSVGGDYESGKSEAGLPKREFWIDLPAYQVYFDQWKDRPEYTKWIQRAKKPSKKK